MLFHEYSKNGFLGQGTDNNIKCNKDKRLCIPTLLNKLRSLNPGMFTEANSDTHMLTLSDGKVLPKVVIERLLKEAAIRLKQDPRILSSHSLRAGGCTAMYNARYADHEIQRRGRWVSTADPEPSIRPTSAATLADAIASSRWLGATRDARSLKPCT